MTGTDEIQAVFSDLLRASLVDGPLDRQLGLMLDKILSITWLAIERKGTIFLAENDANGLVMKAQRGLPPALIDSCARVPFGRCLCGRAAQQREIVFADHVDERHDVTYPGIAPHGHYCIPIVSADRLLGVITLYVAEGRRRDRHDEEFLATVSAGLGSIIVHRHIEEKLHKTLATLRGTLNGVIQAMSLAIEMRDPYTAGHQRRVSNLARAIATEIGLPPEQVDGIRLAGIVHDLGKICVPAEVLTKPARLTEAEFAFIRRHSQVGFDILKVIDFPWPIAQIVLQHHERLDGSGYPQGLAGEQILLEARILCVADVVEAMASHRPYRPALGLPAALKEIEQRRGSYYDGRAVDACLRLFREKGFALDSRPSEASSA